MPLESFVEFLREANPRPLHLEGRFHQTLKLAIPVWIP